MTKGEALLICRMVRAACPAQQFDEFTIDVWSDLLGDLDFEDARAAVRGVAGRQQFIAPAEIRAEVARIRRDRLDRAADVPPDADPDDVPAYLAALRAGRVRAASADVRPRPVAELVTAASKSVDSITGRAPKEAQG